MATAKSIYIRRNKHFYKNCKFLVFLYESHFFLGHLYFNPLNANPIKWPNSLKQFVGK